MRYAAFEKLEIIRLVEQSHLPIKKTLEKLGVSRATFYRWYDLDQIGGLEALADKPSRPSRVWNHHKSSQLRTQCEPNSHWPNAPGLN
jgi:putative transposase